ncbi:hypothetical protein SASPL_140026 [Salvia splendens]|uniref:Alcohol dehydrogenase-like C-terminal domain-containing protein n=1 Tax=Salvia splendens TaxID=180675 RepID=A0A8X8WPH7_SALSN|nr:hypothetical protein SASPL_140026 [Salvia splendens]
MPFSPPMAQLLMPLREKKKESVLQISKAFGVTEIIAVDVQDEKLNTAKAFGATHGINARKEDAIAKIKEVTDGRGVDIAVDALGGQKTFQQCIQSEGDRVVWRAGQDGSWWSWRSRGFSIYKFEEAAKAFQDLDNKTIIGRAIIELM